jgi:hypothetical protein
LAAVIRTWWYPERMSSLVKKRAVQLVEQLIYHRYGVGVLDSDGVQRAVVDAEAPRAVLFLKRRTGDENADVLRRTMPWASMAAHWRSSSSLWAA